jgi:Spy/CpxP family protein refolding chaperone
MGRHLGLTDAQNAQIRTLLTEQRTALEPTRESLRRAQKQLDASVTQVPPDKGLIQVHVNAVSTIQAQLLFARAETESKIYQLLTSEQQQKVQDWLTRAQQRGKPSRH